MTVDQIVAEARKLPREQKRRRKGGQAEKGVKGGKGGQVAKAEKGVKAH